MLTVKWPPAIGEKEIVTKDLALAQGERKLLADSLAV